MKKFFHLINGSEAFEWVFEVSVEQAIERLQTKVSKTSFSSLTNQGMAGTVGKENTKIQRVIPMVGNSFKPFLVGSFTSEDGKAILSGVFRFHRFVQAFMTFWFGFIILWVLIASIAVLSKPAEAWFIPLFGILMLGFGVGLVTLGKWFARNDKRWLKENISNAINQNS